MERDYIRPDEFTQLNLRMSNGETIDEAINAKWDRIDSFTRIGAFILKITSDQGVYQTVLDAEQAERIHRIADVPIIERDFIYESEHEFVIKSLADTLREEDFGL